SQIFPEQGSCTGCSTPVANIVCLNLQCQNPCLPDFRALGARIRNLGNRAAKPTIIPHLRVIPLDVFTNFEANFRYLHPYIGSSTKTGFHQPSHNLIPTIIHSDVGFFIQLHKSTIHHRQ
ncbi:unnamed protein product, partial [Prunus brigantina]